MFFEGVVHKRHVQPAQLAVQQVFVLHFQNVELLMKTAAQSGNTPLLPPPLVSGRVIWSESEVV